MPKSTQFEVRNIYGQTTNEIAAHNSTISRLDAASVREGFSDNGERILYYLNQRLNNFKSLSAMDVHYKRSGFFKRLLKDKDLTQIEGDINIYEIKNLMRNGATFIKSCEILGYQVWVARYKIGRDFDNIISKEAIVAEANGFLTRREFNIQVLKDFLKGVTRQKIAKSYKGITISTVSRIIDAEIKVRIDLKTL